MAYCQQDKALYETLLEEYARSAGKITESMQEYYETKDWKQYGILVHALKSTSRMIGAETPGKEAEMLEKAAKEEDGACIEQHHAAMMEHYRIAAEAAARVAGVPETEEEEEKEILEFPPA